MLCYSFLYFLGAGIALDSISWHHTHKGKSRQREGTEVGCDDWLTSPGSASTTQQKTTVQPGYS